MGMEVMTDLETYRQMYTQGQVEQETSRLHGFLKNVGWTVPECRHIAPMTLRIRELAAQKNAIILGHSYVTPDVLFGVADERGDSLGLSQIARDTPADVIVFCGVRFMGETAKILSPNKTVLLPAPNAGCSLSEGITAADVRNLRTQYPDAGVVCYVNTTAEVKAECDACCTSANVLAVIESMPQRRIVFVPDRNMAANLRPMTSKEIISYDGGCIVHERLKPEHIAALKLKAGPDSCVMVHTESPPDVVAMADVPGGTGDMVNAVKSGKWKSFVVVTEDGMTDRFRVEYPHLNFTSIATVCPYMKMVSLQGVLDVLQNPTPEQTVQIAENVRVKALQAIEKMFEYSKAGARADRPHSNTGDLAGNA